MKLDLTNSDKLSEDFANYTSIKLSLPKNRGKVIFPTRQPSGERLEDEFGGSINYPSFDRMNDFKDAVPIIQHIGDMDYETTPYGYTTDDDYSNFRAFGIGKETEKQKERKAERREKRKDAKEERSKMRVGKRIVNISNKYNPAVAVPRTSALTSIRINLFGLATRLYPALLTEKELKNRNFDLDNAKRAKVALEKVKKAWIWIGGSTAGLEKAIRNGYKKPIFKTKKAKSRAEQEKSLSDFFGYSNATGAGVGAYLTVGLPIVGTALKIVHQSMVNKNPYQQGSKESEDFGNDLSQSETDMTLTPEQQAEVNKMAELAKQDLDKGLGLDDSSGELEQDDILGIPKTAFYIGLGVLVLVGGFFVYKKFIAKK